MTDEKTYPEQAVVNMTSLAAGMQTTHEHRKICGVNDHVVTLAVNEVDFPWHHHSSSDEFFYVVEGQLRVEYKDGRGYDLGPNDTLLVPSGTVHRTLPQGRVVNLLVEQVDTDTVFFNDGESPRGSP
jgi:mannose-6-phosphate isomerase-like protein (cupin superfamily)